MFPFLSNTSLPPSHTHTHTQGVVCTLHEGDEFGKLALVNEGVRYTQYSVCLQSQHKPPSNTPTSSPFSCLLLLPSSPSFSISIFPPLLSPTSSPPLYPPSLSSSIFRSASIQARDDNCSFLRVEQADFRRILLKVESTTVKMTEHGREVMLLERVTLGRYLVVKGTPDKMLDHLLEMEADEDGRWEHR